MTLRRRLGILPGQDVVFEQRGSDLVLRKSTDDPPIRRLRALLAEPLDVDAYLEEARGPAWDPTLDGTGPKPR